MVVQLLRCLILRFLVWRTRIMGENLLVISCANVHAWELIDKMVSELSISPCSCRTCSLTRFLDAEYFSKLGKGTDTWIFHQTFFFNSQVTNSIANLNNPEQLKQSLFHFTIFLTPKPQMNQTEYDAWLISSQGYHCVISWGTYQIVQSKSKQIKRQSHPPLSS